MNRVKVVKVVKVVLGGSGKKIFFFLAIEKNNV